MCTMNEIAINRLKTEPHFAWLTVYPLDIRRIGFINNVHKILYSPAFERIFKEVVSYYNIVDLMNKT